jgi:hypothetical protein
VIATTTPLKAAQDPMHAGSVILESAPAQPSVAAGPVAPVQQPTQTPAVLDEAAADVGKPSVDAAFVF